jgi:hypothetical protein
LQSDLIGGTFENIWFNLGQDPKDSADQPEIMEGDVHRGTTSPFYHERDGHNKNQKRIRHK